MNGTAIDAGATLIGNAFCRAKGFWSRAHLSSLALAALGACLLMPATSQAKEISMQDNQGQNPPSAAGTRLPEGVFPPIKGYTNQELATAACQSVDELFQEHDVDPTLARESLFDLFNHLTAAYQANNVDYQISTWYQKPYDNPAGRTESVKAMAEEFNALTIRAAGDALIKSPLGNMSRDFQRSYLKSAGMGVQNLIETLNQPGG